MAQTTKVVKFHGAISRQGRRLVINIPKALHLEVQGFLGRTVTVTIEEQKNEKEVKT